MAPPVESFTLRNYKSFGVETTIPLQPITVLVGANNSGKSTFLGLPGFLQEVLRRGSLEGSDVADDLLHRPSSAGSDPLNADNLLRIGWCTATEAYSSEWAFGVPSAPQILQTAELLTSANGLPLFESGDGSVLKREMRVGAAVFPVSPLLNGLKSIRTNGMNLVSFSGSPDEVELDRRMVEGGLRILRSIEGSRLIKLETRALREDADAVETPTLEPSGRGAAALLNLWKGAEDPLGKELSDLVRSCLPEVSAILSQPAPDRKVRLWVRQQDGERFDARHCSDGVLSFIGLCMHALLAGPGALMMVEEPEHSIHPRRLHQYVELLRRLARDRGCQFVIATHSPVLLNEFRDEPEAILLFNRSKSGTRVRKLSDVPDLAATLAERDAGDSGDGRPSPGLMLQDGFFADSGA
jgi:predicted ATPase